jgi:hypothetical protein
MLWIRDPDLGVLGSRSISYTNEHNTINWKGKFNEECLWMGPVGTTEKGKK